MTEELKVVLRRSENSGFGFSLLGTTGPPHVIYDIIENSPAADCGAVEAGDVILKVNGTDVHRYTTKEVLKCLRLSDDLVTLELKRDPKLKAHIKEQLAKTKSPHYIDIESPNIYDYKGQTSPTLSQTDSLNSSSSLRYKSPTHLPRQTSANHSRSSSASSAKVHIVESGNVTGTTPTSTSPSTCRPSRIPTALKNPQKNIVQHSPQHKRPRASQIPTKATAAANGNTTTNSSTAGSAAHLQHSNSYSGSNSNRFQEQRDHMLDKHHHHQGEENEPVSAPPQPTKTPRFEAYMMTGDLILNLSRTPQSSNLIATHAKKVDSLRDSPNRAANRANGALAPRASGESSPTSSSSVESPTHSESSDSVNLLKKKEKTYSQNQQAHHQQQQQQKQQQQQQHSINNTFSNNSSDRQCRKDSLTNDTLLLCEELDRDDDEEDGVEEDLEEEENLVDDNVKIKYRDNNSSSRQHQHQQQQQHQYRRHQKQRSSYEENEEDQTNYDITNIETYNSISIIGPYSGVGSSGGGGGHSDQQRLVMNDDDLNYQHEGDEDLSACVSMSSHSIGSSASAKQRLKELKQQKLQQQKHKQSATATHAADSVSVSVSGFTAGSDIIGGSSVSGNTTIPTIDLVDCSRETQRVSTQQQHHFYQQQHHSSSSSSGGTVKSDGGGGNNTSQDETSFSVPTSPISLSTPLLEKETANSVPTSPEPSNIIVGGGGAGAAAGSDTVVRRHNGVVRKCDSAGFRTSKSEDHLQQIQREGIAAVIPIDIDEDVNSSLNTLLDTRPDSEDSQASNRDRIVWTYNAPLPPHQIYQQQQQQQPHHSSYYGRSSPNSHSSSISSSPHHTDSPASPTSVSSSVMSSSGSKSALGNATGAVLAGTSGAAPNNTYQQLAQANTMGLLQCPVNGSSVVGGGTYGDHSVSEAISNISSPDYQDDDNLLSSRDLVGMVLSDPSDSDSTILVSDAVQKKKSQQQQQQQKQNEHKLVIQVRGMDSSNSNSPRSAYSELKDSEDELATLTEEPPTTTTSSITVIAAAGGGSISGSNGVSDSMAFIGDGRESSPPVSDDGSDVESLHSYHYSPKAVDMPSAIRLAKRLYSLDGFKKSDVSRHLSKNNDFSRAVADEYLKYFYFENKTLDQSLREFLQQFALSGETQERERVLVHFSKRFLDCNPGSFNSQDAVHTLTCAIMLLNTDLHGQNIGRKMSCAEFVDNLAELNDGENFPKDVLKYLYQAIKSQPLEWALDEEISDLQKQRNDVSVAGSLVGQNPFLDIPESSAAVEYKKGYVMRKCCYEANYKKTPFGKRSWKMFYCTLRDLVLFLHKDEHGFRKSQMSDNLHNAIRIHHALATKATDYIKKQHVFRLQTADQAEYLFQTSDSKELQSWVETINFVCAAYSAPPLEGGVGSQKRFQRPLLPSTHTKLLMKEQLDSHEQQVLQLENALAEHKKGPIPSKGLPLQNYKEKESYLQYELRRYKSYVSILNAKLLADQQIELQMVADEEVDTFAIVGSGNIVGGGGGGATAQRTAHVIISAAGAAATNQTQSNSISGSGSGQQQQQSANRKKEKKK